MISLLEVQAPTEADFAAKRDQIREHLLQGKQQEIFELFVTNLREQMEKSGKIKINQEELKTLTRSGKRTGNLVSFAHCCVPVRCPSTNCHPERSEGSRCLPVASHSRRRQEPRSLASLGMTNALIIENSE